MTHAEDSIPVGLCQCGCGQRTPVAVKTHRAKGIQKGVPVRFLIGHHRRKCQPVPFDLDLFCACGCGQLITVRTKPSEQPRYVHGHNQRRISLPDCWVEDSDTGCHLWLGATSTDGYGHIQWNGRPRPVHVAFWEQSFGPVPAGLVLHHRCECKRCVNPAHLEPMTRDAHIALHRSLE